MTEKKKEAPEPITRRLVIRVIMSKDGTVLERSLPTRIPDPQSSFRLGYIPRVFREVATAELQLDVRVVTGDDKKAVEIADQVRKFLLANDAWDEKDGRAEGWLLAYGDQEPSDPI